MSGRAASATRRHRGPRVGARRLSWPQSRPPKRRHLARSPLGSAFFGRPPSPPLAPQPPGRGGEASWPARASAGAPGLAAAVHSGQPGPRSAGSASGPTALRPRAAPRLPLTSALHPSFPQCSRSRPERKGPRPRRTKPKGSESCTPTSRPLRLLGDLLLLPGRAPRKRTGFGRLPPPNPTPPHGF